MSPSKYVVGEDLGHLGHYMGMYIYTSMHILRLLEAVLMGVHITVV